MYSANFPHCCGAKILYSLPPFYPNGAKGTLKYKKAQIDYGKKLITDLKNQCNRNVGISMLIADNKQQSIVKDILKKAGWIKVASSWNPNMGYRTRIHLYVKAHHPRKKKIV